MLTQTTRNKARDSNIEMRRNIALSVKNIHQKCIVCLRYTIVEKSLTSRRFFFTRRLIRMSFLSF